MLLEAVSAHADDVAGTSTPEFEFGWRYATAWLSALKRLAPPATRAAGVLVGRNITLDALGRLVYSVRSIVQGVEIFDFRGAVPDTGASTVRRLGRTLLPARDLVLARLEEIGPSRSSTPTRPLPAITAR